MSATEVLQEIDERRLLAAKRYAEDPLPQSDVEARTRLQAEIRQFELEKHVVDLEMQGYTILYPGKAASLEFTDRMRDTILRVSDERDARGRKSALDLSRGFGRQLHHVLPEDQVFEEAVTNPVALALVTYLAGYRARLSTTVALLKSNESDAPLRWHCDNSAKVNQPWPRVSTGANVNWLLTDYTRDNGALCVVPGSHNWCRPPDPGFSHDDDSVEVIEAPAGSLVIWHANLWHAALPRKTEGLRINLVTLYLRSFMQQQEAYILSTSAEMLERNPARFGVMTGVLTEWFFGEEGPHLGIASARTDDMGRWV